MRPYPHHLAPRRGAVAVLVAFLIIPLLALVALCVDYGYLLVIRTDLQRSADAAALAAVRDLVPSPTGYQDLDRVRNTLRQYAAYNQADGFVVLDADIEIGRYDPATIYSSVNLLKTGVFDTVRVTLRRDSSANSPVSLVFARVMGIDTANVSATATAVLQKAARLPPGTDLLPIAIPVDTWNAQTTGDTWSVYGDGRITDKFGNLIPGNWGTLDVGPQSNSTSDLNNQILNGLKQSDLDALYEDGKIDTRDYIDGSASFWASADTGLSVGMKASIEASHGKMKLIPIVSGTNNLTGENLEFHIVGWGAVKLEDSRWNGGPSKRYVKVTKAFLYDGDLRPHPDLSNVADIIDSAFTSPALIQ